MEGSTAVETVKTEVKFIYSISVILLQDLPIIKINKHCNDMSLHCNYVLRSSLSVVKAISVINEVQKEMCVVGMADRQCCRLKYACSTG